MKLDTDELEVLQDAAHEEDVELRTGYSGRGMYGEKCVGVVAGSVSEVIRFLFAVRNSDDDLARMLLDEAMFEDSMGFNGIYYWPGVSVEGGE